MSDVNPTRVDILSLSDDDFGSKYGRDRTTKEVATKNANDAAGYKAAEADFKKEGQKDAVQKYIDEIPKRKAEAEQRMKEYKEGRAKSMEQFNANMQKIGDAHDAKMKELRSTTKSGGSGAAGSGVDIEGKTGRNVKPKLKAGGMVSSASKRADGCAIKGKTKGKMV